MICPLRLIQEDKLCQQNDCAWWLTYQHSGTCSITNIAQALNDIATLIEDGHTQP